MIFFHVVAAFAGDFQDLPAWGTVRSISSRTSPYGHIAHVKKVAKSSHKLHFPDVDLSPYPSGTLGFNPQPVMTFNEWHTFQVAISPEKITSNLVKRIKEKLRRQTFLQYTSLKYVSREMVVQVVPDKPDEFEIKPSDPVVLDIVNETIQEFSVRPLKVGDLHLYLKVKALIIDPSSNKSRSIPLPEQSKLIKIEVKTLSTMQYAADIAKEYSGLWPVVVGVMGTVALLFKRVRIFMYAKLSRFFD